LIFEKPTVVIQLHQTTIATTHRYWPTQTRTAIQ